MKPSASFLSAAPPLTILNKFSPVLDSRYLPLLRPMSMVVVPASFKNAVVKPLFKRKL